MATSHDIGGIIGNQVASFGNMANFSRSVSTMQTPMGVMGQGPMQAPPSFGMVGMASSAFVPMGPAFSPAGSFPGMGMARAGMGIGGALAQAGGGMIPGQSMGLLGGAAIGGLASGGIGGAVMGGGIGMAAGAAGDFFTNTVGLTAQNMSATFNMMQSQRFQFGTAGGQGLTGGFSVGQTTGVARGIETAGTQELLSSVAEVRGITSQLANMGLFQTARDIPDIMGKLGESLKALRTIAVAVQTTFAGALPILGEMRQAGVTDPGMAAGLGQFIGAGQRAGVSVGQQLQGGGAAAQQAMQAGMPGAPAFFAGIQATQNLSRARQMGVLSEDDFQRLTLGTGVAAVGAQPMVQANMQAAMGPMGLIMGGAGMGAGGLAAFGMRGAMGAAANNLANPENMVSLLNRRDEIAGALMTDQFAMVRMARSMAREMPGDDDEMTMLLMQRRFGLNPFQARMQMQQFNARHAINLRQMSDNQAAATIDERMAVMRELSPAALTNRFGRMLRDSSMGQLVVEGTRSFQAGIGRTFERIGRKFTGAGAALSGRDVRTQLASLVSGTPDPSIFEQGRMLGAFDVRPRRPGDPLGLFGGGERLAGGALAEALGEDTEVDVFKLLEEVRGVKQIGAATALPAEDPIVAIAASVRASAVLSDSRLSVEESLSKLRTFDTLKDVNTRDLVLASARVSAAFQATLVNSATGAMLNVGELSKKQDEATALLSSVMQFTEGIEIGEFGITSTGTPLNASQDAAVHKLRQDPQYGLLLQEMTDAYKDGNTTIGGNIAQEMMNMLEKDDRFDTSASVPAVRKLMNVFSGSASGNRALGKEHATSFSKGLSSIKDINKQLLGLTARNRFAREITSGLAGLDKSLVQSVDLTEDVQRLADMARTGSAEEFSRAHRRLIGRAISGFESATRLGQSKKIEQMRLVLESTGLGALAEEILELDPRVTERESLSELTTRIQRETESDLSRKFNTDVRTGSKLSTQSGGGGSGIDGWIGSQTRFNAAAVDFLTTLAAGNANSARKKAAEMSKFTFGVAVAEPV